MIVGWVFIGLEVVTLVVLLLGFLAIGIGRLDLRPAIERDGVPVGKTVSAWQGVATDGLTYQIPGRGYTLLIFAGLNLVVRQELVDGIHSCQDRYPGLGIMVVTKEDPATAEGITAGAALQVPIIAEGSVLFRAYRVRVTPFAHLIDQHGTVLFKGLVNDEEQMVRVLDGTLAGMAAELGLAHGSRVVGATG